MNYYLTEDGYLMHYGIEGQKWGKRNGPPYPLDASQASDSEKRAGWKESLSAKREERKHHAQAKNAYELRKYSTGFFTSYKRANDAYGIYKDTKNTIKTAKDRRKAVKYIGDLSKNNRPLTPNEAKKVRLGNALAISKMVGNSLDTYSRTKRLANSFKYNTDFEYRNQVNKLAKEYSKKYLAKDRAKTVSAVAAGAALGGAALYGLPKLMKAMENKNMAEVSKLSKKAVDFVKEYGEVKFTINY